MLLCPDAGMHDNRGDWETSVRSRLFVPWV